MLAPLGARAADLVVWWEEGFSPDEDDAVREMMAAFEHKTGKTVELVFLPEDVLLGQAPERPGRRRAARLRLQHRHQPLLPRWAREGRLVELSSALGPLAGLINKDALAWATAPLAGGLQNAS